MARNSSIGLRHPERACAKNDKAEEDEQCATVETKRAYKPAHGRTPEAVAQRVGVEIIGASQLYIERDPEDAAAAERELAAGPGVAETPVAPAALDLGPEAPKTPRMCGQPTARDDEQDDDANVRVTARVRTRISPTLRPTMVSELTGMRIAVASGVSRAVSASVRPIAL